MSVPSPEQTPLEVFYDGGCPVCSREIEFYRGRTGGGQVVWVDVTSADPATLGADLTHETAMARMHARRPDGTLASGAAAFGEIWRRTPGLRWLGRLVALPGVNGLAELGYGAFLRIRPLWR